MTKKATCPICQRTTGTFVHNGRRIYVHHYRPDRTNSAEPCDASGWLVEDDELVTKSRKQRSDAGIARPSRRPA